MTRRRRRERIGKKKEPVPQNNAQDDSRETDPQEEARRLKEEIERLKKENERLEKENDIFRKIIGSKGLDTIDILFMLKSGRRIAAGRSLRSWASEISEGDALVFAGAETPRAARTVAIGVALGML